MDDPYPQAGTSTPGPRCSFCGAAADDVAGDLARGPDVWICRRCVRQAAKKFGARLELADGDGTEESSAGPQPEDYGAAYLAIESLYDPITDLLHQMYGAGAVELVVEGMRWESKNLDLRPDERRDVAEKATKDMVWYALRDQCEN